MKKLLLGLFCILILVGCGNGFGNKHTSKTETPIKPPKTPEWWEKYNIDTWDKGEKVEPFTLKDLEGEWISVSKNWQNKYEKIVYTFTYNEANKNIDYTCNEYTDNTVSSTYSGTISKVENKDYFIFTIVHQPPIPPEPAHYEKYQVYKNCILVEESLSDPLDWKAGIPYFKE